MFLWQALRVQNEKAGWRPVTLLLHHSQRSPRNKRQKRRVLTLEEKYKLVKAIKKGVKHTVVAKRFDPPLSQCTISTIMKKKDDIVSAFEGGLYKDKRKKMKQSTFPDLDKALSE